jgi:hypothetical protein
MLKQVVGQRAAAFGPFVQPVRQYLDVGLGSIAQNGPLPAIEKKSSRTLGLKEPTPFRYDGASKVLGVAPG